MLHGRGRIAALAIASLLALAAPGSAHALILTPPATDCAAQEMSQRFAPWGDEGYYTPLADGRFEAGAAAWRLDRATVVGDDEASPGRDADDRHALALSGGATATSPPICIGLGHPTMRFLARNVGSPLGAVVVEAMVRTTLGITLPVPIGIVGRDGSAWQPTPRMLTLVNLLTLLPPGTTDVTFRFQAIGPGSAWVIDDVYVDPYAKR